MYLHIYIYIFVLLHLIGTIFTMKQGSTKYLPWARNFAPLTTRASCHHTSLARNWTTTTGKGRKHRITWSSASSLFYHQSWPWQRVRGGGAHNLQRISFIWSRQRGHWFRVCPIISGKTTTSPRLLVGDVHCLIPKPDDSTNFSKWNQPNSGWTSDPCKCVVAGWGTYHHVASYMIWAELHEVLF